MALCKFENITLFGMFAWCTENFIEQFFNNAVVRPMNLYYARGDDWLMAKHAVKHIVDSKLEVVELMIYYNEVPDMKSFLTEALDAISKGICLHYVRVTLDREEDADNLLFFMKGLRQITPRMQYFSLDIDFLSHTLDLENLNFEISKLQQEISDINRLKHERNYRNVFLMVSANTLSLARIGPTCLLRMLPIEVLYELHGYLCDATCGCS